MVTFKTAHTVRELFENPVLRTLYRISNAIDAKLNEAYYSNSVDVVATIDDEQAKQVTAYLESIGYTVYTRMLQWRTEPGSTEFTVYWDGGWFKK